MLFSVVAVSETWLHKSNSDLFIIPDYHFISNSREHKLGGGVGLYIQSDMNFKPRIDLQSSDNSLYESVFVEIMRPHGKNIIVGCLYRPHTASLNDFNRSVEDILSAISFENKLSYIMVILISTSSTLILINLHVSSLILSPLIASIL